MSNFENTLEETDNCDRSEIFDETANPRVQIELQRLNSATDLINKLETDLDTARSNFRQLLCESSVRVNQMAKRLGSCVEGAKPYYEARAQAKNKMPHHTTLIVNGIHCQKDHQSATSALNESEKNLQHLHQEIKKSIIKSSLSTRRSLLQLNNLANQHQLQLLPYFEMKSQFNELLEEQRKRVHQLEESVLKIKLSCPDALHNPEETDNGNSKIQESIASYRDESESMESSNFGWDGFGMPFRLISNSNSCDDIFGDNMSSEDLYMSLPPKLKGRSAFLVAGSVGDWLEVYEDNLSHFPIGMTESTTSLNKISNDKDDVVNDSSCLNGVNKQHSIEDIGITAELLNHLNIHRDQCINSNSYSCSQDIKDDSYNEEHTTESNENKAIDRSSCE